MAAIACMSALSIAEPPAGPACGRGQELYAAKCSQCHGDNGDGRGVGADFFTPRPRDFTSGAFKIRTTESGELPTDADLHRVIRMGMPYTGMPAWPSFSDAEIADLACYLKGFNPDFADTSIHPKQVPIPKAPAWSAASAEQGRAVYAENKCMDCHGKTGRGDGESAPTLKDDWGNPIRPADLAKRWTFRGGAEREDIYRTIVTGLNGTPMPSFASSISEADRWKLVDFVYSLSPKDGPAYASMVTAARAQGGLVASRIRETLASARPALFPVVGQVIEGRRDFFPAANAVSVRAAYDSQTVAVLVAWHDMSAQTSGSNSPGAGSPADSAGAASLTDAVALQMPATEADGPGKPYFLFGDKKHPVAIRFAEAGGRQVLYLGKGMGALAKRSESAADLRYADGEWSAVFLVERKPAEGPELRAGEFLPIAFSVWDGFGGETGEKRGVTSWYTLYLRPEAGVHPALPAGAKALGVLAAGALAAFLARRSKRRA
jgi:DMSO reductase family type II enzyme heme b subunit